MPFTTYHKTETHFDEQQKHNSIQNTEIVGNEISLQSIYRDFQEQTPLKVTNKNIIHFVQQVYFFKKKNIPENKGEAMEFAKKLAAIGLFLPKYQAAYTQANEER